MDEVKRKIEAHAMRQARRWCVICGRETNTSFNIDFKKTPICDRCADAITVQQVTSNMMERFSQR